LPAQQGKLTGEPASIPEYVSSANLKIRPDVVLMLRIFHDCLFQKLVFYIKKCEKNFKTLSGIFASTAVGF